MYLNININTDTGTTSSYLTQLQFCIHMRLSTHFAIFKKRTTDDRPCNYVLYVPVQGENGLPGQAGFPVSLHLLYY